MRKRYALIGLLLIAALGVGLALIVPRLADDEKAGAAPQIWSVEDARRFDEYPVYWLGESFQGLPLTAVARMNYDGGAPGKPWNHPWHEVSFVYGDCEIAPGEESCPAPLSVDVRPYCEVPPEVIADAAKTGPPGEIRGAVAQRTGLSMRLWTSNVSIGIAATDEGLLMPVAQNLVRLNGDRPSTPEEALGAPDDITCPPMPGLIP